MTEEKQEEQLQSASSRRKTKPVLQGGVVGEEELPKLTGPQIKYQGSANIREITVEQWTAIDCPAEKDSRWTIQNSKMLPVSDFSEGQLNYLLNVDGEFQQLEEGEY